MTGHLATLTSQAENDFVWSLVDFKPNKNINKGSIWLGGVQPAGSTEPGGSWSWVTGEAWSYTNWAPVEPNDTQRREQHLTFDDFTAKNGTWNDWTGTNGGSGYVIAYSARVAEPGALALLQLASLASRLRDADKKPESFIFELVWNPASKRGFFAYGRPFLNYGDS